MPLVEPALPAGHLLDPSELVDQAMRRHRSETIKSASPDLAREPVTPQYNS